MKRVNVPSFSDFIGQEENISQTMPQEAQPYPMDERQEEEYMPVSVPKHLPQMSQQQNPFEMQRYSNVQVPDTPLQFGGGIAESLLNDNEVPDKIKDQHWWVFHKDNTLTFLDEERKKMKMLSFDIAKIDILNTTPYYD